MCVKKLPALKRVLLQVYGTSALNQLSKIYGKYLCSVSIHPDCLHSEPFRFQIQKGDNYNRKQFKYWIYYGRAGSHYIFTHPDPGPAIFAARFVSSMNRYYPTECLVLQANKVPAPSTQTRTGSAAALLLSVYYLVTIIKVSLTGPFAFLRLFTL